MQPFFVSTFCSNDHNKDNITIVPIEEISLEGGGCLCLASKQLQREEYWYKELAAIYPYGLNNNVKNLGNLSQKRAQKMLQCGHFLIKKPRK